MRNILIILALLIVPYIALWPLRITKSLRGRIGVSLVMAFAAIGHFVMTAQMAQMLPPWVPMRTEIIYASGLFEAVLAVAILAPPLARAAGILACLYLVAILPSNIYAAIQRVDFGGHAAGPTYFWLVFHFRYF